MCADCGHIHTHRETINKYKINLTIITRVRIRMCILYYILIHIFYHV